MGLSARRSLVLASALAVIAGACGQGTATTVPSSSGPGPSTPAASSATTSTAPSIPTGGDGSGTWSFVVDSEPTTLATEPDDLPTSWITGLIYSTLYQPDYKINYVPLLADGAPTVSADGLTWDVKIKDGVKFHDGSPLTADDVKFSYDLHLSKNCRGNPDLCSASADNVASVTATDPHTVQIVLKQKYAPFLSSGLGATLIRPEGRDRSLVRALPAGGRHGDQGRGPGARTRRWSTARRPRMRRARRPPAPMPRRRPPPASTRPTRPRWRPCCDKASIETINKAQYNTGGDQRDRLRPRGVRAGPVHPGQRLRAAARRHVGRPDRAVDQDHGLRQEPDRVAAPTSSSPTRRVRASSSRPTATTSAGRRRSIRRRSRPRHSPSSSATRRRPPPPSATTTIQWQPKIESDAYTTVKDNPAVQIAEYADNGYYYIAFNLREGHVYCGQGPARGVRDVHRPRPDGQRRHGQQRRARVREHAAVHRGPSTPTSRSTPSTSRAPRRRSKAPAGRSAATGSTPRPARSCSRSCTSASAGRSASPSPSSPRTSSRSAGSSVDVQEGDLNTVLIPKVLDYPNNFDTYLGGWSTALDPDDYSIFHSSEIPTAKNPSGQQLPGLEERNQADKLLEQGRRTTDQAERKDIYFQFQTLIHDEAPYYFLWADKAHTGLSARMGTAERAVRPDEVGINYYNQDAWTVTAK